MKLFYVLFLIGVITEIKCSKKKLSSAEKEASVRLHVFTSDAKNKTFTLTFDNNFDQDNKFSSICDSSKTLTKFIVHGFAERWNMTTRWDWVYELKKEMLRSKEASQLCIVIVDWKELANGGSVMANYWSAIKKMKIGAELIAGFFKQNKINEKNMHCIGFSLGAHMCGVMFEVYFKTLKLKPNRITGLDPAGPFFKDKDFSLKLDMLDAEFVDVIHTSDNFGLSEKSGLMDFYGDKGPSKINSCDHLGDRLKNEYVILYDDTDEKNGKYENVTLDDDQLEGGINKITEKSLSNKISALFKTVKNFFIKGPKKVFVKGHQFFGCSHLMAVRFFIYSINECVYKSKLCPTLKDFKKDSCYKPKNSNMVYPRLGYYADRSDIFYRKSNGNFFLHTTESAPYCLDKINYN